MESFLIALPVHNGGRYFRDCVDSLLAQDYPHFQLLVLDNASTDDALEWLAQRRDERVSVLRSSRLLPIEDNWARILSAPNRHSHMTIIGHDDLLDAQFLTTMRGLIRRHPNAGLYQSHFRLIDAEGRRIRSCVPIPSIEGDADFLSARLAFRRDSFGTGYVFRSSDYTRVGGIPTFPKLMAADDALWIALMRGTYKATEQGEYFSYRVHSRSTSYAPDWQSTYRALERYLGFLIVLAQKDARIRDVLSARAPNYVRFWFRWAYLSVAETPADRRSVEDGIGRLMSIVETVLDEHALSTLKAQVRGDLHGTLSQYRWFLWRGLKWLRVRYWDTGPLRRYRPVRSA
jgi:glycosyltransferase involved in cell wall biosynthesis